MIRQVDDLNEKRAVIDRTYRGARYSLRIALGIQMIIAVLLLAGAVRSVFDESAWSSRLDFRVFYAAGVLLRNAPERLYDAQSQLEMQRHVTGLGPAPQTLLPFVYPAFAALPLAALTLLSVKGAYLVMCALNLAFAIASVWILSRRLGLNEVGTGMLALCAASFLPLYAALFQGQFSVVVLFIFVLAVTDIFAGRMGRAGASAGLLVLKPTLLPVIPIWLLFRRQWRGFLWCTAVAALLAVTSIAIVGMRGISDYFNLSRVMLENDSATGLVQSMPNLKAFTDFFRLGDVLWLAAVAGVLLAVMRLQRPDAHVCASLVIAAILISPHFHIHDLGLVVIPAALALNKMERAGGYWLLASLMQLPLLFALGFPLTQWPILPAVLVLLLIYTVMQPASVQ
jgi:hypothetical protein